MLGLTMQLQLEANCGERKRQRGFETTKWIEKEEEEKEEGEEHRRARTVSGTPEDGV